MAKVDLASGKIEKEANTDCRKCVHFVSCESGKQIYVKLCGVNCRDFEEYCATCEHKTDNSGYCTECYYGGKWQRKSRKEDEGK